MHISLPKQSTGSCTIVQKFVFERSLLGHQMFSTPNHST